MPTAHRCWRCGYVVHSGAMAPLQKCQGGFKVKNVSLARFLGVPGCFSLPRPPRHLITRNILSMDFAPKKTRQWNICPMKNEDF